jgi:hypothetical protein
MCAAGLWISTASGAQKDNPMLEAVVGTNDGFDISLDLPNGQKVSVLEAGTYTVVVHDRSALHNFHLASNTDGSVDFRTDVDFVGDQTFTVTFKAGNRYAYACEPHWQVMNGQFVVPAETTTTTTAPPPPAVLNARVTAAGAVSLRPAAVQPGLVRVAVRDDSKKHNFHLRGAGTNRKTGLAFVGKTTWTVRLATGTYHFGTDPRQLRGTLRVR